MATNNAVDEERPVKLKLPDDFKDEQEFLAHIRKLYSDDVEADQENRDEAREDHRFVAGRQWDENVYQRRINLSKPALTINRLPAFVAQSVGNARLNQTVINVIPDRPDAKLEAALRKEIIRSIQKSSNAKRAYNCARQNQYIGGIGAFEVLLDYTDDDVFEQDIMIGAIDNPDAVVWDRLSCDPTGADANHVFVTDRMERDAFKKRWPDATTASFADNDRYYLDLQAQGWADRDTVRIASFWRIRTRKRTLALMDNGEVNDVTDLEPEDYLSRVVPRSDGSPAIREVNKKYAQKYLVAGADVLEGPYELPISRVPVFRVPGWEINVGDVKVRFGQIRFARDPQRLHNYWRSIIAEKLIQSPKAKWIAGKNAVKGREDAFRRAHLIEDPLVIYDDEAGQKPEQIQPVQLEPALIQEAGMAAQDIKDVLNKHEAALGQVSNEVSGDAIIARQRVSELGDVIYNDNFEMSLEEAGKVINQLIPFVYDTPRVLKITGDSPEEVQYVRVNFGEDQSSIDITKGKYNITSTTGPSFETKRIEARESMMGAVNAMPDAFASVADLIAEAQDWPGADKMAERIRNTMNPSILGQDLTPEQQAAQQAAAQEAQIAKDLEIAKMQAEISERQMRALKAAMEARKAAAEAGLAQDKIEAEIEKIYAEIESQDIRDTLQTIDAIRGENNVSG